MSKSNFLVHITGSISAYKACLLISGLVKQGHSVQTSLSKGGSRFIGDASLQGLTARPVIHGIFDEESPYPHITWADWADHILIYPASANTLTRLSTGLADDFIGALFLANNSRKPFWIAPAMNSNMFAHPLVQEALQKLEKFGCRILPTEDGRMACGTMGKGRLISPEYVLEELQKTK